METKGPDGEALRLAYQTSLDLYKFFGSWRHQLLAGYLATISGLGITFGWTYSSVNNARPLTSLVCLTGLFLTAFFWLLERRNRSLYRACTHTASEIEKRLGFDTNEASTDGRGVFTALQSTNAITCTHSRVIDALFVIATAALVYGSVYSYYFIV
jgi:hypothetical protein